GKTGTYFEPWHSPGFSRFGGSDFGCWWPCDLLATIKKREFASITGCHLAAFFVLQPDERAKPRRGGRMKSMPEKIADSATHGGWLV
ncbi:hypothetical protein, partial [Pseudomonas aeruginosa]|uniref:hypothetical protein n=1 Tax=Pseudomonas aeruginosa TaxID=287 RepID=UPI001E3013EC